MWFCVSLFYSNLYRFFSFETYQKCHGFSNKTKIILLKSCVIDQRLHSKDKSMVSGDLWEKVSQTVFSAILLLVVPVSLCM